uniref:tRNA selenocysteine-associated protein 1 n=1 Tax=Neogobius melanostomus TaxID=47308 RepID=A0A8C6X077_9GOBI
MFNRQTSLWMGDLDPYMDENFIKQAFSAMGESPLGVKIITHRITGGSAGYCFVELADEESVERCVQRLNGKLVPGSNPPRKFKLNYATYGKRPEPGPEFSVFVGDLASEVDDYQLHQAFKKYPSCKGAKVVTDQYGYSRGYGFVKFGDENEQKKAIEECQGTMLAGKPLRLSIAVAKRYNFNQIKSSDPNQLLWQHGRDRRVLPQWGSYDQYSGYNTGYNPAYGTGYSYNYNPYGYPLLPISNSSLQYFTVFSDYSFISDPLAVGDVDKWNKDFIQRSEELYEALMNSHWEPLDSVDSPIPSLS